MYIEKIHIDVFGKLRSFDMELDKNINLIEGKNESGKSTIASFIKFIFYGATPAEKPLFIGWHSNGAKGYIIINEENRRFKIERALAQTETAKGNSYREGISIVDLSNNMPCYKGECPGEVFFGIDSGLFASTAFISQNNGAITGGDATAAAIQNIMFSADESVNTKKTLAKIDAERVALLHKNGKGGRIYDLKNEYASIEERMNASVEINKAVLEKEEKLHTNNAECEKARKHRDELKNKLEQYDIANMLELANRRDELLDRADKLEAEIAELNPPDEDKLSKMRSLQERIEILKDEAEKANTARDMIIPPPEDKLLDEFISLGEREGVEAEAEAKKAKANVLMTTGIVLSILGIAGIMTSFLSIFDITFPLAVKLISACISAFGLTMVILGFAEKKKHKAFIGKFDLDRLEEAKAERERINASISYAMLAADDANTKLKEAEDEAKKLYSGSSPLKDILDDATERHSSAGKAKAEMDKCREIINTLELQLNGVDVAELKASVRKDIDFSDITPENVSLKRKELVFFNSKVDAYNKAISGYEKELAGLYPKLERPTFLSDRLSSLKDEIERLTKRYNSYKLAYDSIEKAADNLRNSIAPNLAKSAADYMSLATGGKYQLLGVSSSLNMSADTDDGQKAISVLSAGTQDLAYISLRLSLINLIYRLCSPMLVFDEVFSRLDPQRTENLFKIISHSGLQAIIFTSNPKESDVLRKVSDFRKSVI